ncbi:dTDP-4-dehydrorhamnose 3,5-epimerase [Verrucomicrobia bacterium]|nr:dTDP-4-dehydrorhamnose 3,5-epimerase [Verrucomicrobiota bacterium]
MKPSASSSTAPEAQTANLSRTSPAFTALPTGFPGLALLQLRLFQDPRGLFVKTFHAEDFRSLGLPFEPREEFYSTSARHVLRGMHFQLPPAAHAKLVYCLSGRVLDVVLDMRRGSPRFAETFNCELSANPPQVLFIPVGFAHGFLALENDSLMVYKTDAVHDPQRDTGIAWDSFGFKWPVAAPVMSERDRRLGPWLQFSSPF